MSMYNMIMEIDEAAEIMLPLLFEGPDQMPPRFRNCSIVKKEGEDWKICLYTRQGGGNREAHAEFDKMIVKHPLYLRDYDDDFDNTYCTYEFRFPKEIFKEEALPLIEQHLLRTLTPGELFKVTMESFLDPANKNEPDVRRIMDRGTKALKPVFDQILNGSEPIVAVLDGEGQDPPFTVH